MSGSIHTILRKPDWLRIRLPNTEEYSAVKTYLRKYNLHTICESGNCPNQAECWSAQTATLMILGNTCTRSCKFCNVDTGKPTDVDFNEPEHVAEVVKLLNLKHAVVTSVTRDDLQDGGAALWAQTIKAIKRVNPSITMETLIPDFNGETSLLDMIIEAAPEIISHNLETVKRLTPMIRSKAKYEVSLSVIQYLSQADVRTKSGIMLGLGETYEEVLETMDDLLHVGCKVFTLGQYLQPTRENFNVVEYITPEQFEVYKQIGYQKGFSFVESGPLVRSSYNSCSHL